MTAPPFPCLTGEYTLQSFHRRDEGTAKLTEETAETDASTLVIAIQDEVVGLDARLARQERRKDARRDTA